MHHRGYALEPLENYVNPSDENLAERGRESRSATCPEEYKANHPVRSVRQVGDRQTWMIPFSTHDMECPSTPDTVFKYRCFSIWPIFSPQPTQQQCEVSATVFQKPALRYNHSEKRDECILFVRLRMDKFITMEAAEMAV